MLLHSSCRRRPVVCSMQLHAPEFCLSNLPKPGGLKFLKTRPLHCYTVQDPSWGVAGGLGVWGGGEEMGCRTHELLGAPWRVSVLGIASATGAQAVMRPYCPDTRPCSPGAGLVYSCEGYGWRWQPWPVSILRANMDEPRCLTSSSSEGRGLGCITTIRPSAGLAVQAPIAIHKSPWSVACCPGPVTRRGASNHLAHCPAKKGDSAAGGKLGSLATAPGSKRGPGAIGIWWRSCTPGAVFDACPSLSILLVCGPHFVPGHSLGACTRRGIALVPSAGNLFLGFLGMTDRPWKSCLSALLILGPAVLASSRNIAKRSPVHSGVHGHPQPTTYPLLCGLDTLLHHRPGLSPQKY